MDAVPETVSWSEPGAAARRYLGEPEHFRIWCITEETELNHFRRLEFHGWLLGWGEGLSAVSSHIQSRTEVTLFLTVDGRLVTTVNVTPGAVHQILRSPPDCWAMYLGDHGSLEATETWLRSFVDEVGPEVMAVEAVAAGIERARSLLDRLTRTTAWEAGGHRERAVSWRALGHPDRLRLGEDGPTARLREAAGP